MKAIRRFTVRTLLPEPIQPLARLATNLRWSWHRPTRELFASLDQELWEESRHDPISLLGSISRDQLDQLASNNELVERVQHAAADLDRYLSEPRWYQGLGADAPACIAYFSPEFGIT
ncbi:glucan phosphorylase, partial [Arthrobacter bambusae]|nr:glucan phosphorylase [Arthrobacter bambusae]